MKRLRFLGGLGLLAVLGTAGESCADLPTLAAGQCGNGVVDPGEDCDSFPADGCRPPGDRNQCHFNCTACPSGWGCDRSALICRQPVGAFATEPSVTFEATAARLELADFDGDGRQDIIAHSQADSTGRESLRVFYFDGNGAPAKSLTLGASAISPVSHDLDNDVPAHRADLMFAAFETGINVMIGRSDRTFGPIAFPRFPFAPGSSARFVRVNGIDLKWEVEFFRAIPVLFAEIVPGKYSVAIATTGGADPRDTTLAQLDRPANKILGEPIAANIIDGAGRECEEVLWVWKGEGAIQWVEPCGFGNFPKIDTNGKYKTLLALPGGDAIQRPPVALDLNSDGHVDLLLEGELNAYVAFGRGDGTFSGKPDLSLGSQMSPIECAVRDPRSGKPFPTFRCGEPLAGYSPPKKVAANDQVLIAFPQFVLAVRKVDSTGPKVLLEGIAVAEPGSTGWSVARFDDFNANGYIDIVAASSNASDIDFFNGTPTELFNPGRIRTDSPVRTLSSGDYDGDLVNDLGFVEIGAGGGDLDGISVAYGKFAGVPEAPLRLGVFPNVIQAQTAKAAGFDETLQLGVVYQDKDKTDLIAILEGAGERQLLSPFAVAAPLKMNLVQSSPFVLSAGDYDGDGIADAMMLGYDQAASGRGALRPWYAKGKGDGRFDPPVIGNDITNFTLTQFGRVIAVARSADLDGDKRADAVVLAPSGDDIDKPAVLMTYSLKDKAVALSPPTVITLPASGFLVRLDLELADVDGDSKLDAVIAVHGSLKSHMLVAWGNGNGTFDIAGATRIDLGADVTRPRSVAIAQLDTDPARELLVSSGEATYAVQGNGRTLKIAKILPSADAVVSGDITGDGLPDIALAKDHRIAIYPGVSR